MRVQSVSGWLAQLIQGLQQTTRFVCNALDLFALCLCGCQFAIHHHLPDVVRVFDQRAFLLARQWRFVEMPEQFFADGRRYEFSVNDAAPACGKIWFCACCHFFGL
jgi:hypothetical protein